MNKFGIDWTQRTTRLGAIVLFFAIVSLVLILSNKNEQAAEVMTLAGTVLGLLGVVVKD